MPTVAEVVVDELIAGGVRAIFGVPGGASNLDLIQAVGKAGLRFVLTATETAAAIAAIGHAEVTGQPGACLTTLGPGAASATNGVACACLERAPVLVFTDSHGSPAFEHQRLDQAALFASITNASVGLTAANARTAIAAAVRYATEPRPGPVHIQCPGDVGGLEVSNELVADLPGAAKSATSSFAADALSRARKPLLLIGLGARRPGDAAAIRALCDRHHIPAMVTYKAKGVVPDDHPWFAGVFTNGAIERPLMNESDLLIGLGLDPVELIPRAWGYKQPIVYAGPWAVEDAHVPFASQHIASIGECVRAIGAARGTPAWDASAVHLAADAQRQALRTAGPALTPDRVIDIAAARLAAGHRVTVDAGAHMFPATMLWPASRPNDLLISNGLSTMGFAVPAAIGAAVADGSRPVVALTGDGGLLMCAGELLTAVRERLRLITVVFKDASLSLIEIKQQVRRLDPAGVALGVVDWCRMAESVGMPAFASATGPELDAAITSALACTGPSLIEATVDRSTYSAILRTIRG
jgi:acetolactate synthase-1/2/3 large subunit